MFKLFRLLPSNLRYRAVFIVATDGYSHQGSLRLGSLYKKISKKSSLGVEG